MDERNDINKSALNWLYEIEAIQSPVLLKNLYENVLFCHLGIKDCKIFITPEFTEQKGILVFVELKFFTNLFSKEEVHSLITEVVNKLLPSYRVRVVDDEKILEMAQEKVKEYYGSTKSTDDNNTNDVSNGKHESESCGDKLPEASDLLPNKEESTENVKEEGLGAEQQDIQDNEKV